MAAACTAAAVGVAAAAVARVVGAWGGAVFAEASATNVMNLLRLACVCSFLTAWLMAASVGVDAATAKRSSMPMF
jgi:hypothetical protein